MISATQIISIAATKPGTLINNGRLISKWFSFIPINGFLFASIIKSMVIFPFIEGIFVLLLFKNVGKITGRNSFYLAGALYFIGVGLMSVFIFAIRTFTFHFMSTDVNSFYQILTVISQVILAGSYAFFLEGFLKIRNNISLNLKT